METFYLVETSALITLIWRGSHMSGNKEGNESFQAEFAEFVLIFGP